MCMFVYLHVRLSVCVSAIVYLFVLSICASCLLYVTGIVKHYAPKSPPATEGEEFQLQRGKKNHLLRGAIYAIERGDIRERRRNAGWGKRDASDVCPARSHPRPFQRTLS